MVLTLKAYRRGTPERNRSIPTIPAGRTDVGPANVSAVDTGLAGVSPGFLRHGPAPPSQVRPHRSLPAACAGSGGQGSAPAPPRVGPIWLELACSTRVGIYWPRVVRTARRPHLPEVHPTLLQWRPTLVQCVQTTPAATTVTKAPLRQGESAALPSGRHTHRCLEMS